MDLEHIPPHPAVLRNYALNRRSWEEREAQEKKPRVSRTDPPSKMDVKTNFERWKEELTPEDMVVTDFGFSMGCCAFYGHYDGCIACPAKKHCLGKDISCAEGWMQWANAPAKES